MRTFFTFLAGIAVLLVTLTPSAAAIDHDEIEAIMDICKNLESTAGDALSLMFTPVCARLHPTPVVEACENMYSDVVGPLTP